MKPFSAKSTSLILPLLSLIAISATPVAAKSTSIFIDQIPLYSRLASCAEDRVSAIIRAQFSGCGDNMQLTSFSCFCIDSSTEFNSILSTAVEEQCALTRTGGLATITKGSPEPEVTKVQELFASYCSKTTLLTDLTSTNTAAATGTQGPQTATAPSLSTATSTSTNSAEESGSSNKTPIAAIVVPCVIVPLALIAAGAFFFIRRRRNHTKPIELADSSATYPHRYSAPKELVGDQKKHEMGIGEDAYAHELGPAIQPVELQGGSPADWKRKETST
ncbi:hypothetical protein BU24DRAFT_88996 [Aaosphaeria arxii CBS 175.79]|uniref:Extracellular membrane protein CFEM domain-containing protein n=1 Tax=Aaosphaeria arxii CBS 175.79 TaxID=1450172 RepID=A0A6A5X895_9PLEO|nr:uncharacterized protein BU24DRAFT_88996 [Aaosphaeria arxii CBS 175.79]KAF2008974.1 hypothetical protein BU24DRAFT_88996 [Aaosphaeria arxii CBS 175.79]